MTNNLNLSRDEYCFIDILFRQLESQQKRYINIDRKSDKTLNFCYKDIQVGRIKLQGKKNNMQVLFPNSDKVSWFEGTYWDYIEAQKYWVAYLGYLKRYF